MATRDSLRAACLTPPIRGGIAVVQVIGLRAGAAVTPLLKSKRFMDLEQMPGDELRLCQIFDGDQPIDDALVAVRHTGGGEQIVDISMHGGPRIVQRVLLLLKGMGINIVEPIELLSEGYQTCDTIEQEMLELLLRAKTRNVASWLIKVADKLRIQIKQSIQNIQEGDMDSARRWLVDVLSNSEKVRLLLEGVRVVLIGEANTGKSTLANVLAERERAVVSDVPGTTRDWVEHPGAINGIPFTFVDTAGIRESTEPIEIEAVRRAHGQIELADLMLRVIDISMPPTMADRIAIEEFNNEGDKFIGRRVYVWNKSDRPMHADHKILMERVTDSGGVVSAHSGEGIDHLRNLLARVAGVSDFSGGGPMLITGRQVEACEKALSALTKAEPDNYEAVRWLKFVVHKVDFKAEDRHSGGYN
ncbi:MAG: 50S ribosome-binding GTPase [Planctomycetota bacterium]|nr:MAG: 50S ribosome-binding GTPase [Planctomycetota bacterium]